MPTSNEVCETKNDSEDSSDADEENVEFEKESVLGSLHNLIADCASILKDAESLLEDCYNDRKALLELLSVESDSLLIDFIETTLPNWHDNKKNLASFQRVIAFSKCFAKDGQIVTSLIFLLTFKKNFASLLMNGKISFLELKNCFKQLMEFQSHFTPIIPEAVIPMFNITIDALIKWLADHEEIIQASENIGAEELGEQERQYKSISEFIKNLNAFCYTVQIRLFGSMLIHIDDTARIKNLCLPCDLSQDRGTFLLEQYLKDPELKEKIEFMSAYSGSEAIGRLLTKLDQEFLNLVAMAKQIDNSLGPVKRISYLDQNLDPRLNFARGLCAGDGRNWCQNMLNNRYEHSTLDVLAKHFICRQDFHSEAITHDAYLLQMTQINDMYKMSLPIGNVSIEVESVDGVKRFCDHIFDFLHTKATQNKSTMCFEIALHHQPDKRGHLIAFCRFFKEEVELWRIRDVNYGEFEASFYDLKEWFSGFYAISIYTTELKYRYAIISEAILTPRQINTLQDDRQIRALIEKNTHYAHRYSIFADYILEEILGMYQTINAPTIKDNLSKIQRLLIHYVGQLDSNPKHAYTALEFILKQALAFNEPQYNILIKPIQIAQLIALFNSGELNSFSRNLPMVLSSVNLEDLKFEDDILLKMIVQGLINISVFTTKKAVQDECVRLEAIFKPSMIDTRATLMRQVTALMLITTYDKSTVKALNVLLENYLGRAGAALTNNSYYTTREQFERTGLQEDAIPLRIEKAMQTYVDALRTTCANEQGMQQTSQLLSPSLLLLKAEPVSRPLTFMKTLENEMIWEQWQAQYHVGREQLPETNRRPGPGALVVFHSK